MDKNEYNKMALSLLSDGHKMKRVEMLAMVEWQNGDGGIEGVYHTRPKGHRAVWSCRWSTGLGMLDANGWYPLETLTFEQLKAEALDVCYTRPAAPVVVNKLSVLLLDALTDEINNVAWWAECVKDCLRQLRIDAPEYIWPYDPPKLEPETPYAPRLMTVTNANVRPGWGTKEEILEKARLR